MAATVFGTPRYGLADDTSATGLFLSNRSADYSTQQAEALNHTGSKVARAFYDDGAEFSVDGVVETKATGFVADLASVISLANSSADSLDLLGQNMFSTPDANDGLILSDMNLTRTNNGFETGSMSLVYSPLVATNSPSTVSD